MWCVCLFLGPPIPFHLVIPKHATPFHFPSLSPTSPPRRRRPLTTQQVGDLGHTLLATAQSNPIPKQQQQQRKQEEGEEAQLSGSDVLFALQRATSRKNKKNKLEQERRRRVSSSAVTPREQTPVDYTNVPPLCIKPHWAAKLDELEKRLHDLSDNII